MKRQLFLHRTAIVFFFFVFFFSVVAAHGKHGTESTYAAAVAVSSRGGGFWRKFVCLASCPFPFGLVFLMRIPDPNREKKGTSMLEYKIVLLGSGGVGKSALTVQYVSEIFVDRVRYPFLFYVGLSWRCSTIPRLRTRTASRSSLITSSTCLRFWTRLERYRLLHECVYCGGQLIPPTPRLQEQFTAMRDMYMRNGHGFILVYSIVSEDTFKELQNVRDRILSVKDTEDVPPMILVGNKLDLEEVKNCQDAAAFVCSRRSISFHRSE